MVLEPAEPSAQAPAAPPRRPPALGAFGSGALSVVFVVGLVALPIVGLAIAPLGLIPVAQYLATGHRGVRAWGWAAAGLGLGAFLWPDSLATAVLAAYLLVVSIPALSLEGWLRVRWSEGRWAAVTAGLGAAYCLALVATLALPRPPVEGTRLLLRQSAAEIEQLSAASGLPQGQLALLLDTAESAMAWVLPSVPLAYLVMVLFWIRPRLPLLGFTRPTGSFEHYRSEEWLPAVFILTGAATLLLAGTARWVALNLLVAVLILYFVHGLAIIRAHLARWLGRGWLVRWGIGLLSLQLPLLVAALGLVDSFHELRPQANDNGRTA